MAIVLNCPCGRKLQIKDEYAGQEGQCPACGRMLAIPTAAEDGPRPRPAAVARAVDPPAPPQRPPPRFPADEAEAAPADLRDLPNHSDGRLPADADFFAPAPRSIGPLRSAYTTLREGKQPLNPVLRLLASLAGGLGGLLVAVGILIIYVPDEFWVVAFPVGVLALGGIGAVLGWAATRFRHTCTYVGRDGVARFVFTSVRENLTTQEVFLFREAVELRIAQTHQYTNGIYTGTTFAFIWYDAAGRKRYTINGSHRSNKKVPPPTHYFHFARAAELAWTLYLLNDVDRQLQTTGAVPFRLTGGQWVRLGKGSLTLGLGGEPVELDAADVRAVQVHQGVVRILRVDAEKGWFSSRGVYKFNYASLANARLFFHLLDKVVGVRVV